MARRKIRHYLPTSVIAERINKYFREHKEEVIQNMLKETGFDDLNKLHDYEFNYGFGFDCGWVWVKTRSFEQEREWVLDNGKYDALVTGLLTPYSTQSTTLKKIMVDDALEKLGMSGDYFSYVRLD